MKAINTQSYFPIVHYNEILAKNHWLMICTSDQPLFLLEEKVGDELLGKQYLISYDEREGYKTIESLVYDKHYGMYLHSVSDDEAEYGDEEINELDEDDFSDIVNRAHEQSEGMER